MGMRRPRRALKRKKRQKGGKSERPRMGAQKESKTSGMMPVVLPNK